MSRLEQIETALRNADAAGDADAARILAAEYQRERSAASESPLLDVAKSAGVGIGKGVLSLGGIVGDMSDLGAKGIEAATNYVSDKLGVERYQPPMDRSQSALNAIPTAASLRQNVESVTGEFYKPQTRAGRYAQSVGEFAPAMAIGPGGWAAKGLAAVGGGIGAEAGGELAEGQSPGWQTAAKIAGGTIGAMGPGGLARAITPNPISPARQRLLDVLEAEGVTSLTAGQRTGNKSLQYAESILGDAPGAGSGASRIQQEGQRQFTEATMRRAGAGLPDASPEVLAVNNARLAQQFRDLSARNTLTPDNQFITDLTNAVTHYRRVPDSQQRQMVQGYIDDIVDHVNAGAMPGTHYQEMRSRLSRQSNSLRQSDPTLSEALRDIRVALDDAMERSIPAGSADAALWRQTRREYAAQKTIEKAASRAGEETAEGQIKPANLRNTVAANNRGAYARGEGDFSELSRAGSGVMAPLPNSGTGQRNAVWDIFNTATVGAIPAVSGRVLMSRPVQQLLANQLLAGVPMSAAPTREALARALLAQDRTQLIDRPR